MDKADYKSYMRTHWATIKDDAHEFLPSEVVEVTAPLEEQHQVDKRSEKSIISDAD